MQARTRGIGTHLRVGKRQRKREEPRRGGGAHIVGRHLMWEASAEAWWWTPQAAAPRAKAPVRRALQVGARDPSVGGEAQGCAASFPTPTPPVGGEDGVLRAEAGARRAAAATGERRQ